MCNREYDPTLDVEEKTFSNMFSMNSYGFGVSEDFPESLGHECSETEFKDTYMVNL